MSANFDYTSAKLLAVFSSQYLMGPDQPVNFQNDTQLEILVSCGANGFILIPIHNAQDDSEATNQVSETERHYRINEMVDSNILNECVTSMKTFANNIKTKLTSLGLSNRANFWIGLPQIDSTCYPQDNTELFIYQNVMKDFVEKVALEFGQNSPNSLWANMKGFYYNQECIYNPLFNADYLSLYYEGEVLSFTSSKVHNTYQKDLIWIPYIHAYSVFGDQDVGNSSDVNAALAKEIVNIAKLTNSHVFDCEFIQSYLSTIYGWKLKTIGNESYNYTDILNNNTSWCTSEELAYYLELVENRKQSGETNIRTIKKSVEDNTMYYRFAENGTPVPVITNTSSCVLGAEYELAGDIEFSDISVHLFDKYRKYDTLSENKPLAFYWQATNINSFSEVIKTISAVFSGANNSPKSHTVDETAVSFVSAVPVVYSTALSLLANSLNQPATTSVNVNYGTSLNSYAAETVARSTKAMFNADYSEKFWVKNITYTISTSGNYANMISYAFTPITGSTASDITLFNNNVISILNSLNIPVINLNNGNVPEDLKETEVSEIRTMSSDFEKFHKIFQWLITNVAGTDSSEDDYVEYCDTAFGAIALTPKYATYIGFAKALAVLCKAAGIPCVVADGTLEWYEFTWNYVKLDGHWWFVDVWRCNDYDYKYRYFLRETPSSYHLSNDLPNIKTGIGTYIKYGDVDDDGIITATDASLAYQKIINPSYALDAKAMIAADVTATGSITINDYNAIMAKCLNGTELPVENYISNTWF